MLGQLVLVSWNTATAREGVPKGDSQRGSLLLLQGWKRAHEREARGRLPDDGNFAAFRKEVMVVGGISCKRANVGRATEGRV